jgi:broad specificity phosphatase PhoE
VNLVLNTKTRRRIMKIGLIRHFKVLHPYPGKVLVETTELLQWFKDYEKAEIEKSTVDLLGIHWKHCYSSDLSRSIQTAEHIYSGNILKRAELREIPITPFKIKLKLPFLVWAILVRLSWHIHLEKKKEITKIKLEINKFIDEVMAKKGESLIVSHGALMILIAKELKKRGFNGPKLGNPQNGKLYVYQKE